MHKNNKDKTDYEDMEEMFEKVEKIFQEDFGKRCPDFAPLCGQCEFWLIFNKFKQDIFKKFV